MIRWLLDRLFGDPNVCRRCDSLGVTITELEDHERYADAEYVRVARRVHLLVDHGDGVTGDGSVMVCFGEIVPLPRSIP